MVVTSPIRRASSAVLTRPKRRALTKRSFLSGSRASSTSGTLASTS